MSDRSGARRSASPWHAWVFAVLAVGWAAVAIFSTHARGLAVALAVIAAGCAAITARRKPPEPPSGAP